MTKDSSTHTTTPLNQLLNHATSLVPDVLTDVLHAQDLRPISASHVLMDMLLTLTARTNVSHARRKSFTTPTSTVQPQLSHAQLPDHACVNQTNGMILPLRHLCYRNLREHSRNMCRRLWHHC